MLSPPGLGLKKNYQTLTSNLFVKTVFFEKELLITKGTVIIAESLAF